MLQGNVEDLSTSLFHACFTSITHIRLRGEKWESFYEALPAMLAHAGPTSCLAISVKGIVLANW